eukprot:s665_g12.t1
MIITVTSEQVSRAPPARSIDNRREQLVVGQDMRTPGGYCLNILSIQNCKRVTVFSQKFHLWVSKIRSRPAWQCSIYRYVALRQDSVHSWLFRWHLMRSSRHGFSNLAGHPYAIRSFFLGKQSQELPKFKVPRSVEQLNLDPSAPPLCRAVRSLYVPRSPRCLIRRSNLGSCRQKNARLLGQCM